MTEYSNRCQSVLPRCQTGSEWIPNSTVQTILREMWSRTQFHVSLKISLTYFIINILRILQHFSFIGLDRVSNAYDVKQGRTGPPGTRRAPTSGWNRGQEVYRAPGRTPVHCSAHYANIDNQLRCSRQTGSAFCARLTTCAEWVRVSEWRWCILFIRWSEPKLFLMTDENITNWKRSSPEPWLDLWDGFPWRKREGKKKGAGDTWSRKRWDVAEWQRIENTKQRRDKRDQNGWNGQKSSLYRKDVRVACPTVSSTGSRLCLLQFSSLLARLGHTHKQIPCKPIKNQSYNNNYITCR